jgi:uncharacterized nucleotidyltransferase DUF6036
MTPLDRAVHDITGVLEALHVDYAIVGGIANAIWGEPRATIDVDVTVSVSESTLATVIRAIGDQLRPAVPNPLTFVQQTRVLPLDTADGIRVDVIFALVPFEMDAIRRAQDVSIAGRTVRVVTAEDLVLMKIISERPRDIADAEAIVRRRLRELDRHYLEPRISELSAALENPDIVGRWRQWTAGVSGREP